MATLTTEPISPPEVEFFTFYPDAPPPVPALDTLNGSLPVRANQFCLPVTTASDFGWYLVPLVDLAIRWDGRKTHFAFLEENEPSAWKSLGDEEELFLSDGLERLGVLSHARRQELDQIMTPRGLQFIDADLRAMQRIEPHFGLLVRTSPGWSPLVRSVLNEPYGGYRVLEGITETSWYRSLASVMVRLNDPGKIVCFLRSIPSTTLQFIPHVDDEATTTRAASDMRSAPEIPEEVWREHLEIRGTPSAVSALVPTRCCSVGMRKSGGRPPPTPLRLGSAT